MIILDSRIYCACSSWQLFHEGMEKAKRVLECNQYPPNFYDPIIKDSLNTILRKCQQAEHPSEENTTTKKFPLMIQYSGKCPEEYSRAPPLLQCPLYYHNDNQETKNHHAFSQTTRGEDDQKRYCLGPTR